MRAFVRLREVLASNKELGGRLHQLEKKLGSHGQTIAGLVNTIRNLIAPPEPRRRPIGFVNPDEKHRGKDRNARAEGARLGVIERVVLLRGGADRFLPDLADMRTDLRCASTGR